MPELTFSGSGDDDTLIIDTKGDNLIPESGISFTGKVGTDAIMLQGTAARTA